MDVSTHTYLNMNVIFVKVSVWMCNLISCKTMDVNNYPCPNLSYSQSPEGITTARTTMRSY